MIVGLDCVLHRSRNQALTPLGYLASEQSRSEGYGWDEDRVSKSKLHNFSHEHIRLGCEVFRDQVCEGSDSDLNSTASHFR